jgi:DNA polymerase-1
MEFVATTNDARRLLHNGTQALSVVESNGLKIDVSYVKHTMSRVERKIQSVEDQLLNSEVTKVWKKTYKRSLNFQSRAQLGDVLFNKMGYKCSKYTEHGKPVTDEEELVKLGIPYVELYLRYMKLNKALNTYLKGILREVDSDGFLHPVFSLHLAATFRSSSESPNFQNIPIRLKWVSKLVRRAFIPRPGHVLIESDYSGVEVCISCCYHGDPVLIRYVKDPALDMHRDMAMECFILTKDQIVKPIRQEAKGSFVFAQFYGDYYIDCAKNLWEHAELYKLTLADGTPLLKHLASKGIRELGRCNPKEFPRPGTFEAHIKKVEKDFWGKRFRVYAAWKEKWWEDYQRNGGFRTLTGFTINGVYKKNEVINSPVQGSAFHCLLWSLIETVKKNRKTGVKVCGQIHDSMLSDVPKEFVKDYLAETKQTMTVDIKKEWEWINVPLKVESDAVYEGKSWFDKEPIEM